MATAGITLLVIDLLVRFATETSCAGQPDVTIPGVRKAHPKLATN